MKKLAKLALLVVMFSLLAPASYYGMKNISKKVPKYNLFKKDFSTKAWRWGKGWSNVKNYPSLWNKKIFNKIVIPSAKDIKIENVSIINKDTDNLAAQQNITPQGDKIVVINLADPKQSSQFIQKIISKWTEITEGLFREFYESIPWLRNRKKVLQKPSFAQAKIKHEEQAGGSYWKYFFGGAIALYLAKLFSDTAQQEPLESKKIPFDYSLDGGLARSMSAETFVALLHKHGLTVADAVEYQCKKKEEELYKEITALTEFDEHDWRILQNIWKLREEFLQGHYDEDNITFKGNFDSQTIAMVKSVLQKADIPFQVTVVTKNTATISSNEDALAAVHSRQNFMWTANSNEAEFTSFGFINVELFLSEEFLHRDNLKKIATLAHEATHLINMHGLQQGFFKETLEYGTSFDENKIKNCRFHLEKLHEYQADVLPLAVPEYAQAQKHAFSHANRWFHKNTRPDIYIPSKEMYTLAARAAELHEAEEKLLKNNRIREK